MIFFSNLLVLPQEQYKFCYEVALEALSSFWLTRTSPFSFAVDAAQRSRRNRRRATRLCKDLNQPVSMSACMCCNSVYALGSQRTCLPYFTVYAQIHANTHTRTHTYTKNTPRCVCFTENFTRLYKEKKKKSNVSNCTTFSCSVSVCWTVMWLLYSNLFRYALCLECCLPLKSRCILEAIFHVWPGWEFWTSLTDLVSISAV